MNLLEALEDIERTAGSESLGICEAVEKRIGGSYSAELNRLFRTWPEHSGDKYYPVPAPKAGYSSGAFHYAVVYETLWEGDYGAARRRLLWHCIKTLRQEAGITKDDDK